MPEGKEDDELDADDLKSRAIRLQRFLQLDVKLHEAEHGHCHTGALETDDPDVGECRVERMLAIPVEVLGYDRNDGEQHAHQTVLEDAGPDDVEPSEAGTRFSKGSVVLTAGTFLHEEDTPKPVHRLQRAKVLFLLVEPRRNVLAHESEEAGDGKRLVAVSHDLEVDGMLVVDDAEKRDHRVDRDHKQDTDDVSLLIGHEVVGGVAEDEVEGYQDGNKAEYRAEADSEAVEGNGAVCWP